MSGRPPSMRARGLGPQSVGVAFALLAAISFGTLAIVGKLAFERGAETLPLLATRFLCAALLLGAYHLVARRKLLLERNQMTRLLLLGGLGYAFEASLYFLALEQAPASIVSLIFYSYPLWTNLVGLATGLERFHPRVLVALVIGACGVLLIFSIPRTGLEGPLLALAAALAVTVYFVLAQIFSKGVPAPTAAAWTATGAAVALGTASLVTGNSLPAAAIPHALGLGVSTAVSFALLYGAIGRIGSARASIVNMMEPVTTVVLAALILNEAISLRIGAGALLVVASIPVLVSAGPRADVPAADSA